jgi:hypothetical protein
VEAEQKESGGFNLNPTVILVILIATIAVYQGSIFLKFQHTPGPVFGGDLYREVGFIKFFADTGKYWEDPYIENAPVFYPQLGYILGAWMTKISFSPNGALLFLSLLTTIATGFALYVLGNLLFSNKMLAVMLAGLHFVYQFANVKYTFGMGFLFLVLSLIFLLKTHQNPSWKNKILAGICFGLTALMHYSPFIHLVSMVGSIFAVEFIIAGRKTGWKTTITGGLKKYIPVALIAILISLFFYLPYLIGQSLETLNNTNQYSLFDVDKQGAFWVFKALYNEIFASQWVLLILGLLTLIGLIVCIANVRNYKCRYTLTAFVGVHLAAAHYVITKPLLNNWIVPSHVYGGVHLPFIVMTVFGINAIANSLKNKKLVYAIASLVILIGLYQGATAFSADRWTEYGKNPDAFTKEIISMGSWIDKNTAESAVFLANDESAFAINALTGRRLVMVRRTHASPYVDINKRYADAFVMLYGRNPETQKALLKQYNVSYVFIDTFIIQNPMLTDIKYKDYLAKEGVAFQEQVARWDPSTESAPAYLSAVVSPQNLTIQPLLEKVKDFAVGSQVIGQLFKVKSD